MTKRYVAWQCKIIVELDENEVLPEGFDAPPRRAAELAVNKQAKVVSCASGWNAPLKKEEIEWIQQQEKRSKK